MFLSLKGSFWAIHLEICLIQYLKLKKLRDQGAISDDEFEAKKSKLLEQL